ncbi:class E sortase, partial [Candidatus Saccharibacteria bacterium]|nr:class E sortase [Candidatus Saccharibacteria bacterium]
AVSEAHQKYNTAWQGYYQKYYERYYIAALQEQRAQFASQDAAVDTSNNLDSSPAAADGTLTQKEAMEELRSDLLGKVKKAGQKARKSRHFIPAIAALVVILIAVFIQYNGLIFAQIGSFVSPGDTTDQNIIIGTGGNQPVGPEPRLIIPKINVDAPVIYGLTDLGEESSQRALENGPIHYPIAGASAFPGQNGNTVVLGHSSADWFEPGNFKFIFVQLNRLAAGDLFYLDFEGVRYTYRVTRSEVIAPNQINALAIGEDRPFATLITCDPPGTALRRLVVYADQISPDPNQVKTTQSDEKVTVQGDIAGNPPTLFERIFGGK